MKKPYLLFYTIILCTPILAHTDEKRTYCISDSGTLSAQHHRRCPIDTYPVEFLLGNRQTGRVHNTFTDSDIEGVDTASTNIDRYYAEAKGKTGSALKRALNHIIKQHKHFSYQDVWEQLEYTDEDPHHSNKVIMLYTGDALPKSSHATNGKNSDTWNREHVWPKSHGFPKKSQSAYTDIHHLRPSRVSINSIRSNKNFDMGGTPLRESLKNKTDNNSFEPADEVKGDVSRMLFYMDVRYEGKDNSGVSDLRLVDEMTTDHQNKLGKLCVLLAWHAADPVSDFERRRNERIYERQGNRNPFIDHPEWVSSLYGNHCVKRH